MGLAGSNGAGKTTLLEILATTQLPTAGNGSVAGHDLVREHEAVKRRVGYCPADAESFYPRLTGRANLEFFAALHDLPPGAARRRVGEVLEMLGAPELAYVVFQHCSAGMKQKLGVARALLGDPPVLLFDEPTRSLDPEAQCEFHRLLRQTLVDALGKTILLVTHNLREAETVCDRVALLRDGRIAGVWPAGNLPSHLRSASLEARHPAASDG